MRFVWIATALLALVAFSSSAQAQLRPSDEPPVLPEFPPEERERSLLPPVPMPPQKEEDRLSTGRRMVVTRFEVRGSTVFSDEELAKITAPYEGREIGVADFGRVRNAITAHYLDSGYVTSGASIPDQQVGLDGVVIIEAIEGRLEDVVIQGNQELLTGYIEGRVRRGIGTPINVYELEEQLQLLQQKDLIRSVDAQLDPTSRRGESTLTLLVHEERPTRGSIGSANDQSPAVGSDRRRRSSS